MEKPKKENYGWHTQCGFDDEPTGWLIEGGEEAYEEAIKRWEFMQDNAQLIAAAPDMLKALRIINDDIERGPVRYSYQEKMEIVKKAINKALGL